MWVIIIKTKAFLLQRWKHSGLFVLLCTMSEVIQDNSSSSTQLKYRIFTDNSACFIQSCLGKNLKVIYGNNLHKKKGHSLNLISLGHCRPLHLPVFGPWYWQGWHQRGALTLGELGLPAVSNQVYFEVRDTWTPRAKAATNPTLHSPHPTQPTTSKPPGTTDTQHSCIGSRCCKAAV